MRAAQRRSKGSILPVLLVLAPLLSSAAIVAGADVHAAEESAARGASGEAPPGFERSASREAAQGPVGDEKSALVQHFETSLAKVQPIVARYGYMAAAGAAFLEGIGIPMPGQTLLIASAIEAAHGDMSLPMLILLVAGASSIGASIGYAIGRFGGRALLARLRIDPTRQDRIEGFFAERGGVVVLLGRFVDGLRQLSGMVAGVLEMPWWTFTAYNVAGAVLWTAVWGIASFLLGRDIHVLARFAVQHRYVLIASTLLAIVALIAYMAGPRRKRDAAA